jgi:hypothetical protein
MTSKERLAPMSKLPVIVVSTMTSAEFRAEIMVGCLRAVVGESRQSCAYSSQEGRVKTEMKRSCMK